MRAISKAERIVDSSRSGSVTRKTCFATATHDPDDGGFLEGVRADRGCCDLATDHNDRNRVGHAVPTGVTQLVAPGPEVTMATPTPPVARA